MSKSLLRKSLLKVVPLMALAAVALLLVSCAGSASGATANSPSQVQVTLTEFKFDSSLTTFAVNTPYHFVIKNAGTTAHEWMIMPRGETDVSKALVKVGQDQLTPGATVTEDFTFTKPGDYEVACHMPGHYEAGMKLDITVK